MLQVTNAYALMDFSSIPCSACFRARKSPVPCTISCGSRTARVTSLSWINFLLYKECTCVLLSFVGLPLLKEFSHAGTTSALLRFSELHTSELDRVTDIPPSKAPARDRVPERYWQSNGTERDNPATAPIERARLAIAAWPYHVRLSLLPSKS